MFTQILTIFLCSLFLAWRISFKISSSGPIETFQQKVQVQLSQVAFIWRLICYNFSLSGYICLVRNSCLKVHPCHYVTDVLPGLLDLIFSVEVGFHLEVVSLCEMSDFYGLFQNFLLLSVLQQLDYDVSRCYIIWINLLVQFYFISNVFTHDWFRGQLETQRVTPIIWWYLLEYFLSGILPSFFSHIICSELLPLEFRLPWVASIAGWPQTRRYRNW